MGWGVVGGGTLAVNSRLINYTLAFGNILPKCWSGPCEAAHLTTLAQPSPEKHIGENTHSKKKKRLSVLC